MRLLFLSAAALVLSLSTAARAEEAGFPVRTVGDLVTVCSGGPSGAERAAALNFCHGFAQGVVSASIASMRQQPSGAKLFCLPDHPPTRTATLAEFVTWAKAKDARLAGPAVDGLLAFFKERFPCNG